MVLYLRYAKGDIDHIKLNKLVNEFEKAGPDGVTKRELHNLTGLSRVTIDKYLYILINRGEVVSIGKNQKGKRFISKSNYFETREEMTERAFNVVKKSFEKFAINFESVMERKIEDSFKLSMEFVADYVVKYIRFWLIREGYKDLAGKLSKEANFQFYPISDEELARERVR
jgi:hypothetical protein